MVKLRVNFCDFAIEKFFGDVDVDVDVTVSVGASLDCVGDDCVASANK